jgi:transcriptional regulator
MYIPHQNKIEDWDEIQHFVASSRAADLVTVNSDGLPIATLMPIVWDVSESAEGNYGKLIMHMARANEQWKHITPGTQGLAIVHGAQAYISPTNYSNKQTDHKVVPTWNYQSVHLSGVVEVSEDTELLRQIVTNLTNLHEKNREVPWKVEESDPHYIDLQLKGIISVILHITKVEAKSKLSQNKSQEDRERVVADLLQSGIAGEEIIAAEMKRLL